MMNILLTPTHILIMTKFKEGDVVNHLSNDDYKLIISHIYTGDYDGKYTCTWIDRKGKPHSNNYYKHELKLHE